MKNKKWLTYTIGILLTLVVMVAVAGAGFRVGMSQSGTFDRAAFAHDFDGSPRTMQGNDQTTDPHGMRSSFQDHGKQQFTQGFDGRGNNRGGMPFGSPLFGLIRIAVLGLLAWAGYKFVKNSGWKLTREQAAPAPAPAPVESEAASVEVEEKKESE